MYIKPTDRDGRLIVGDTPYGSFEINIYQSVDIANIVLPEGKVIGTVSMTIRLPGDRPPETIANDYDIHSQLRGCCDPPDPSMKR